MAILMSLGGNTAGDGFLVAPLGTTYDADLALWTDAGTASVTLQASPNPAGLVFSQTSVSLTTAHTVVQVHATLQSSSRGDTTIQVLQGTSVVASFNVTSVRHPVVNFKGRFEARFATDPALYNENPMYTATVDSGLSGRTWGLEGEPDFVPAISVPENLETPVGRVVRLNNPVALRSHAAPVVSTVASITGETTAGTTTFLAGDPLIGQTVDFGPGTYLASNEAFGTPTPEEHYTGGSEVMALFEIHLGNTTGLYFRGGSQIGPFTHKATASDERTRTPDSRPIASGLADASAEIAAFGLPALLQTFSETRIDLLVTEYNALPAGASPQRRNLVRRIGHLLSSVSSAKRTAVQTANPGAFTLRIGTLPQGWPSKEVYVGTVDANLHALPGGSSVITYMTEFMAFDFQWNPFAFHSDELCAHHTGTLGAKLSMHGGHIGDPHTRTVDGTSYDFQSVGEFTLLKDGSRMEVQVRQTPVPAASSITDGHTGLTSCVSVNTAVAAQVGAHRVALQPLRGEVHRLQFYLDGKPTHLPADGIDLGGHRVSAFDASGEIGLRIDYDNHTVVTATPNLWTLHNVWYIDVAISQTGASEGVMGFIPKDSWLPRLRNGTSVGPRPESLHARYEVLYKTFADSWRVCHEDSLFVYAPGTSTETFTDRDWPAEKPPCTLKPQFRLPGEGRILENIPVAEAARICGNVADKDLHAACVFDVSTTGDKELARGYEVAQELRRYGTRVKLAGVIASTWVDRSPHAEAHQPPRHHGESLVVTATVAALAPNSPIPSGSVTFVVDGVPMKRPVKLDQRGRAQVTLRRLKVGEHKIRATYSGGGECDYHSSSSPNLIHEVSSRTDGHDYAST